MKITLVYFELIIESLFTLLNKQLIIMKQFYNSSNYGNDLKLTKHDANLCSHSGSCDDDVLRVSELPYVKKQTAKLDPEQLRKELSEYGAWDDDELQDHQQNIQRWIWISAGDITEER